MKKALLLCLAFSFLFLSASAQQTITGKITDASGLPLAGVSVRSLKSGKLTSTGNDGSFSIAASSDDELEISMIGYLTQMIRATGPLSIVLAQDNQSLMEVVLVGTRRVGRVKTETTAPVDVINVAQATAPTARDGSDFHPELCSPIFQL
ncbi:MAG: carboxypeptidase-like regulatory domain-containing protein [Chitinophagaceae bacterium]|nr:carboxypeptidase-like regulatory domain-containing protein [Chitinophagaceae bacterium]